MVDYVTIIGFIGATLTTSSLVPQVIKIWKTKSTNDISLWMFVLFGIGILFWFTYGILLKAWPIIIANIFTLTSVSIILFFKIKYK